jgi:hypothetical protein
VDLYDHDEAIDSYLDDHPEALEKFDLYRESPDHTIGWCHLSPVPPASGHRTFVP